MRGEPEPDEKEGSERIERTVECAEELSKMIQKLNTALTRGDFEELKEILSKVKHRITELENYLNAFET
ncbi:MAG: hypothetical protein QW797_04995 [Thermoproteota archaeon]